MSEELSKIPPLIDRFMRRTLGQLGRTGFADEIKLHPQDIRTLLFLDERPGLPMSRLVELSGRSKPQITRKISYLEGRGFVSRLRDDADQRVIRLKLTPEGAALAAELRQRMEQQLQVNLAPLSEGELHQLLLIFTKLDEAARQDCPMKNPASDQSR